jgi:uncharacterized protein
MSPNVPYKGTAPALTGVLGGQQASSIPPSMRRSTIRECANSWRPKAPPRLASARSRSPRSCATTSTLGTDRQTLGGKAGLSVQAPSTRVLNRSMQSSHTVEAAMAGLKAAASFAFRAASFPPLMLAAAAVFVPTIGARAQQAQSAPEARVIVTGEGSVSVAPDYAQIRSGVTTRAKTVKEATDANSKLMTAVTAALLESGIAQKDIQTSRFSIQPVYAPQEPRTEPRLVAYSVSNQVSVTIRQIGKVGEILDRLVTAGATDVGNIAFLVSDPSKALDQAREAAIADARRKAEVYARASGLRLGRVEWITEDTGSAPPVPARVLAAPAPVPIASGEDTLRVRITVGFDIAR